MARGRRPKRRMRRGGRPVARRGRPTMRRGGRPIARKAAMRRGGRPMRRQMGGRTGCPPGMTMSSGQCVPGSSVIATAGYRRGGRVRGRAMRRGGRPVRRMQAGGGVECPQGNYGTDQFGKTICI